MEYQYCKIEVFVPKSHLVAVRDALHDAGAGRAGCYDKTCSYYPVFGSWRPLEGADPYDGTVGQLSEGTEYKLELRCETALVRDAVAAAKAAHPYEVPVINVLPLLDL